MIYRFESFELDEERFELRRGAEAIAIPRKSFDLLRHLLRNAGRVVSKEELFAELWPQEHVTESVLPVNIRTIRKALGEDESACILRTVRGRGYSIECRVEGIETPRQTPGARVVAQPLLGRGPLLEELQLELAVASSGHARTMLLYGDEGIGKTTVLEEFARSARRQGGLVIQTRGERVTGAPAFWTIVQLFRSLAAALDGEHERSYAADVRAAIARTEAGMRAFLQQNAERLRQQDPIVPVDGEQARFGMARATLGILRQIVAVEPLILVIDDLHCVEAGSLHVWESLTRELRTERLFVLAAYQGEPRADQPLARALGRLATEPGVRQLPLRGLGMEEIALLAQPLSRAALPGWFVRDLQQHTEGNPFFLRELLRLLAADNKLPPRYGFSLSEVELPLACREAIEQTLQGLSVECNQVLVWASVIGPQFPLPVLEQVSGVSGSALLELLGEAATARLLCTSSGGDARLPIGEYRFARPLVRQALYTRLSPPERVLRHRAVGEAFERLMGSSAEERIGDLADHFFEAAPGGDIDRAADYCVRATRRALARFEYETAALYAERALGAEELRVPRDELRCCCLTLALGDALRRGGRYADARLAFLKATQAARNLGRTDLLAYCALGLAKWPVFPGPRIPVQIGQRPAHEQQAEVMGLVNRALFALGEDHAHLRSRLLAVSARAEVAQGRRGPALTLVDEAMDLARRSGNQRAFFDALIAKRVQLAMPQDAARALAIGSEMVERALLTRSRRLLFAAYLARIPALLGLGDIAGADRDLAVAGDLAGTLRSPAAEYAVARFQLGRALGDGQLSSARPLLERVLVLGTEAGDPEVGWSQQLVQMWMSYAENRPEQARPAIEVMGERGLLRGVGAHALAASFWARVGARPRALEHFEQAAAQDFADLLVDDDWLWHVCTCAAVAANLKDLRRAARLYALISNHAELNVTSSLCLYRGAAALWLGRLAMVLGDRALAVGHFERALAANRRMGAHTAVLMTQSRYGAALQQGTAEERARGRQLLEAAAKQAIEWGIPSPDPGLRGPV